jgi:SOS-response transcriptional repressor LexA
MAQKYLKLGNILKKLLFDNNMKASDLAREVNLPPPTIHRLVTGKSTRPYKSSLEPIADYFSLNVEQLVGEEPIQGIAKQDENDKSPSSASIQQVSLIPWNDLNNISTDMDKPYEKLPFLGRISNNGFATIINDSSMEPIFARGSLLIFDPEITPKDRNYVLVQLQDSNLFVFRQLLIDMDHKYLKPLNPDLNAFKMRLLNKEDKTIGVLIEARQIFAEN